MKLTDSFEFLTTNQSKIHRHKILCIGDIILDKYIKGNVERISPEAPVPIVKIENESFEIGGVANVAQNITGLGGKVILIGLSGSDQTSRKVKSLINKNKKIKLSVIKAKNYVTPLKIRIISNSSQLMRIDDEVSFSEMNNNTKKQILKEVKKYIKETNTIVISDYNKGLLNKNIIKDIIEIAKDNDVHILVDPKKSIKVYKGANIVTPNIKEFKELFLGKPNIGKINVASEAKKIIKEHNIQEILVTMSEKGMLYVNDKESKKFKALSKDIYDVTGAGDTVIATLALMNSIGMKTAESSKIANIAASIVVSKPGTAIITLKELLKELS